MAPLAWLRNSQARREAEILYLRQQLIVLKRSAPPRPRLRATDRLIFVCLYGCFLRDRCIDRLPARDPATLASTWLPPVLALEITATGRSPCPISRHPESRFHGEMFKLGIEIAQSTVAKYMVRRRGPPSQGWKTFLRNHAPEIAAIDLFVVRTIGFKLLYGLAIIHLKRRRLVWTNVAANPTSEWIARQITEAFPGDGYPRSYNCSSLTLAMDTSNDSSARSGENASTMSWSWASPICAGSSAPTPTITIEFALIWLSTRTPLLAVGRKQWDHLLLSRSSADSITNMSGWPKW